ncbi:hypothetical protein DENSPDRAFT_832934 [Dentipellis sp. KUC8613]|nr:hypothetical protein DENSPDRAFT_832934 [Dentipellis sp. KUC8613]
MRIKRGEEQPTRSRIMRIRPDDDLLCDTDHAQPPSPLNAGDQLKPNHPALRSRGDEAGLLHGRYQTPSAANLAISRIVRQDQNHMFVYASLDAILQIANTTRYAPTEPNLV